MAGGLELDDLNLRTLSTQTILCFYDQMWHLWQSPQQISTPLKWSQPICKTTHTSFLCFNPLGSAFLLTEMYSAETFQASGSISTACKTLRKTGLSLGNHKWYKSRQRWEPELFVSLVWTSAWYMSHHRLMIWENQETRCTTEVLKKHLPAELQFWSGKFNSLKHHNWLNKCLILL